MSVAGGDWRNGPAYDYVDEIDVEKIAHEFLRRNDEYAADYALLSDEPTDEQPRRRWRAGGCDFAVPPHPCRPNDYGVAVAGRSAPRATDAAAAIAVRRSSSCGSRSAADPSAAEGDYLDLLALAPFNSALLLSGRSEGAVAFALPLDDAFADRIKTARRLHRLLVRRQAPPATLTAYRRRRLKLALRALDASLAGADYRAIAEALFEERVPKGGAEFRDASLRAQVIRFVRYGVHLMRGGYLDLLRPGRRAR